MLVSTGAIVKEFRCQVDGSKVVELMVKDKSLTMLCWNFVLLLMISILSSKVKSTIFILCRRVPCSVMNIGSKSHDSNDDHLFLLILILKLVV